MGVERICRCLVVQVAMDIVDANMWRLHIIITPGKDYFRADPQNTIVCTVIP